MASGEARASAAASEGARLCDCSATQVCCVLLSSAPLPSLEPADAACGTARVSWVRPRKLAIAFTGVVLGLLVGSSRWPRTGSPG